MVADALLQPCISCGHTDPHTSSGLGLCTHGECGCDGPCTEADVIQWFEETGVNPTKNKYQVLMRKRWTDPEPDTLDVAVQTSATTGEAFVVFTCTSTWLTAKQAAEVMDFLGGCIGKVNDINSHDHVSRCCSEHRVHITPHVDCILR